MKRRALILILTLVAAAFAGGSIEQVGRATPRAAAPAQAPPPVRFVALGDAGDPVPGQADVARTIKEVCAQRGCDFAIYLGDNFYPAGIRSSHDAGLETKFENPFRDVKLPVYASLGNHDNSASPVPGGDGHDNRGGDFQVEYHYRRDRVSNKFKMPARYYTARHGDVQVFAADTNAVLEEGLGTNDPRSVKQLAWLKGALDASTAAWKIVFGHHTYVSNGAHGNAGSYRGLVEPQGDGANLKTFIEQAVCGRADFYFCGHDHHLEWLKPVAACGRTEFIISGAASQPRPLGTKINEFYFQRGSVFGFWWVEVVGNTLRAVAYDSQGNVLFERATTKVAAP